MRKLGKVLVLSALMAFLALPAAEAAVKVSLAGAGILNQMSTEVLGIKTEGKLGYGAGLLLEAPLNQRVGFEFGGIFARRKYELSFNDAVLSKNYMNSYYLPADFRFHFSPVFSLSVGGYYDISAEDDADDDDADHGLQGGIRFSTTGATKFFVDGRYSYGLKDHGGEKFKDIIVLVGVTFGGKK